MKLTRKLIGLQWRERSSLSNIFELIDDGLDCLGLHCAFVKLQPVQWPGVHLPRWESGRFQWSRSDYAPIRPIWPVHEKYNVKEYATRIERAGDQPRQVGQRGRVAEDKP